MKIFHLLELIIFIFKLERRIIKKIYNKKDDQIIAEIRKLKDLNNVLPEFILKYYDYFDDNEGRNHFYFVTDPYEPVNVEILILQMKQKGQKISAKKIITLSLQILEALEYIHSKKLIHRDLRPKYVTGGMINYITILVLLTDSLKYLGIKNI